MSIDDDAEIRMAIDQLAQENADQSRYIEQLKSELDELREYVNNLREREERGEDLYGVDDRKKPKKGWSFGGMFYWGRVNPFPATFVAGLLVRRVAIRGLRHILHTFGLTSEFIGMFLMIVMPLIYQHIQWEAQQRVEQEILKQRWQRGEIVEEVYKEMQHALEDEIEVKREELNNQLQREVEKLEKSISASLSQLEGEVDTSKKEITQIIREDVIRTVTELREEVDLAKDIATQVKEIVDKELEKLRLEQQEKQTRELRELYRGVVPA